MFYLTKLTEELLYLGPKKKKKKSKIQSVGINLFGRPKNLKSKILLFLSVINQNMNKTGG